MATSKVQIYNITLNILGITQQIDNCDSQDNRVITLNNYYNLARDYVLKDFDWNFASSFKTLSLANKKPHQNKYLYCYDYPIDCVCARDIFSTYSYKLEKFEIANDENSNKVILTDLENAVLRYTKKVSDEFYFSSEFTLALCHYLASLCSYSLIGSVQKGQIALNKYKSLLSHAKYLDAQEGNEEIYKDETYLDSRCK